jgi:cytochrome c oxidase subunit 2
VVPGRALPLAFTATAVGEYDLVCAELCGWGHYKMAGRVRVVTREEFERFRVELTAEWNAILEPPR